MAQKFLTNFTPPGTSDLYKFRAGALFYGTTSNSTTAMTVSIPGVTEYYTGLTLILKMGAQAASGCTLNVNSLGAKAMKYGANSVGTYFTSGATYLFVYDGTDFKAIHSYNSNTTYSNMTGATTSAAGKAGLVPAPAAGEEDEFLRGDGTWATPTNTNTKMRVYRQTSGYDGNYPLLVSRSLASDIGTAGTNSTNTAVYGVFRENTDGNAMLLANPAKGTITAPGGFIGNASTATNVAWTGVTGKPSYYDAKAIKSITRSGTTFTYTCLDGTTGTFTQQDNNTTYTALKNPYALTIQGNGTTLTNGTYDGSTAKTVNITPASIGAAASSHTHDDRYYTESETDTKLNAKLDKLTYEWNKEYNAGGTAGYLLIGSFPMYDSNVTIDIDATTTTTYHGTVVIATQNVSTTSMGSAHTITVYGDPTGDISNAIRVTWASGSRNYNVYFVPSTWSKNLIHIRAIGQYMNTIDTTKICTQFTTGTAPTTTSGLTVVNALRSNFNNFTYTHPTSSGNKHIPSGGSSGQILRWSADGTAVWGNDNNTTYTAGTGISISSANVISNSGVRSISTGSTNGTISVNTNGTSANVAVKGLGSAAYTASTAYDAAGAANTAESNAKSYTDTAIANLVDSAPDTLNTLNELAAALGDDANFATTVANNIADKVSKSATGVQTIAGGLVIGATSTSGISGTGKGRIMFTGQTNPLIGVQAVDASGNKKTPYYIQSVASDDKLYIGPTSAKALSFDSEGNMASPANLSIGGTISEGGALLSAKYAAKSHGTHVSYGTSATAVGKTAAAGTASTVSRSDHTHSLSKTAVTDALGYTPGTSNLTIGTTSTTAAAGNHTHSSYVNQNAFSNVKVGETTIAADSATDTVTFVAGTNITLTPDATNDKITIAAKDTVYTHPTSAGNKHIPAGGSSGQILRWSAAGTAAWGSDNNSAHSHSAGVGLTGSGNAGTSGTYTYKVNLVNETAASNAASYTAGGTSKFYAVQLDKNNKLGVYVPWTDNNTTYSVVTSTANGLVPKFDAADGTIDSSSTDWVLTNNNGSIGWYKLPANAFKNDNTNYYHTRVYSSGLKISTGTGVSDMYVPTGTTSSLGVVKQHTSSDCTSYTSDEGATTPAAVKKAFTLFGAKNGIFYVAGNTSGTAGTWTGTNTDIPSLFTGLTIAYKIGIKGASATTLNLTTAAGASGAKTVRRNTGALTTHLAVGSVVHLTYDGTYWVWADYDSNTTYSSMSIDEGTTGTATTNRVLTAANLKGIINAHAPTKAGSGASGTWGINVTGRARFLETKYQDGSAWYGDNYPLYAQWETSNICKIKCDNYYTKVDYADSATKATQDGSGNVITSKYVTLDTAQTISGTKTMTGSLKVSGRYAGSGDDEGIVVGFADNGYAGLCLGGPSEARSVFYFKSDGTKPFWRYNNGSASYDISHPSKSGTIALTSDLANYLPLSGGTLTGLLNITTNGKTTTFGCQNSSYSHYSTNADAGHWFNKNVSVQGNIYAGSSYNKLVLTEENYTNYAPTKTGGGASGTWGINITGNANTATTSSNSNWLNTNSTLQYGASGLNYFNISGTAGSAANANQTPTADWYHIIRMNHANSNGYYTDIASCFHNNNMYMKRVASGSSSGWLHIWVEGNSVTSAVWNDYAECRESDCEEFGYVLMEVGDDSLTKTTERLSHFAGVSSDTWGFSQGETDKAKTPIAVAGRVLVYPYQDRNNYKPGDCVCAAPGGTVDIMTREEVREWPDRIVGTVSCVPDYEEWGGGEGADRDPVKVNGRIWIKVK